jgi:hypothetical protein
MDRIRENNIKKNPTLKLVISIIAGLWWHNILNSDKRKGIMELKGKAHYCQFLKKNGIELAIGDYRIASDEELVDGLKTLGVSIDIDPFLQQASLHSDPEEMVEAFIPQEQDLVKRSLVYLFVFEMWRRFLQEKKNLSIFCDELDYTISLFYEGALGNEAYLQGLIDRFEGILDETVDAGAHPQIVFRAIRPFFTYPMEAFIYDYIGFQLEARNFTYASELIDGFYAYVADPRWFDLLRVRMASDVDILYQHFLESLLDEPDFGLAMETIYYLISVGQHKELLKVLPLACSQMRGDRDLEELVEVLREYLHTLDQADVQEILAIIPESLHALL